MVGVAALAAEAPELRGRHQVVAVLIGAEQAHLRHSSAAWDKMEFS